MEREMDENAKAHVDEAYRLLTAECFRMTIGDKMMPQPNFCGIAADLRRIDSQIGAKGQSIFAPMADAIQAAYVEIQAAREALGRKTNATD
jgi:hypothetical protein